MSDTQRLVDLNSINRLLSILKHQWQVESIKPMPGGMSAGMTLVNFKTPDGSIHRWIVRQLSDETLALRPNAVRMEYDLMQIMLNHGLPVPQPVYLDDLGNLFGTPSLVMEYLPGDVDFSMPSIANRPVKLAHTMAAIHAIDLTEIKEVGVPALSLNLDDLCGEDPKEPNEELNETKIRMTLRRHWPPKNSNPSVLLHGDYWSGNILWNKGEISGVIDWEDAWLGEPLADIVCTRVDLAYTFGLELAEQFTQSYMAKRQIDLHSLPQWDLVAVLWLIKFINHDLGSWASFYHSYGRSDFSADLIKTRLNEFSAAAIRWLNH